MYSIKLDLPALFIFIENTCIGLERFQFLLLVEDLFEHTDMFSHWLLSDDHIEHKEKCKLLHIVFFESYTLLSHGKGLTDHTEKWFYWTRREEWPSIPFYLTFSKETCNLVLCPITFRPPLWPPSTFHHFIGPGWLESVYHLYHGNFTYSLTPLTVRKFAPCQKLYLYAEKGSLCSMWQHFGHIENCKEQFKDTKGSTKIVKKAAKTIFKKDKK